jgi:hypothetical protein
MKKLILLFLIFTSFKSFAQSGQKVDSVYYLFDTTKVPTRERMWHTHYEKGVTDNYYEIQCPCLHNNGKPTFMYAGEINPTFISKGYLESIKLIGLPDLIIRAKQFLDSNKNNDAFFFVEPLKKGYIIRRLILINPQAPPVWLPDVMPKKPDTSAFAGERLINIDLKNLKNYLNKAVITSGQLGNAKIMTGSDLALPFITADSNEEFSIIIKAKNRNDFDAPELLYKGKRVRVTGTVIDYKGKPAIEIVAPNQIQIIR